MNQHIPLKTIHKTGRATHPFQGLLCLAAVMCLAGLPSCTNGRNVDPDNKGAKPAAEPRVHWRDLRDMSVSVQRSTTSSSIQRVEQWTVFRQGADARIEYQAQATDETLHVSLILLASEVLLARGHKAHPDLEQNVLDAGRLMVGIVRKALYSSFPYGLPLHKARFTMGATEVPLSIHTRNADVSFPPPWSLSGILIRRQKEQPSPNALTSPQVANDSWMFAEATEAVDFSLSFSFAVSQGSQSLKLEGTIASPGLGLQVAESDDLPSWNLIRIGLKSRPVAVGPLICEPDTIAPSLAELRLAMRTNSLTCPIPE